jgi:hypothetical protein
LGEKRNGGEQLGGCSVVLPSHSLKNESLANDVQLLSLVSNSFIILCYMLLPLKPTGHLPPRNLGVSGPGILHLRGGLSLSSDSEACETPVNFVALLVRSAEFYLSPTGRFESSRSPSALAGISVASDERSIQGFGADSVWHRMAGSYRPVSRRAMGIVQFSHGHVWRLESKLVFSKLCETSPRVMLRLENPGRS